jgi:hypothetical protein
MTYYTRYLLQESLRNPSSSQAILKLDADQISTSRTRGDFGRVSRTMRNASDSLAERGDSNPRDPFGFDGRNSSRVWLAI